MLNQMIDSPNREDIVTDLLISSMSELIGDISIRGCLDYSDHAMMEYLSTLLRDIRQAKSKIKKLNFRKAKFHLFRELISRAVRSLRKLSLGHMIFPSPGVGSQKKKTRDWHG